MGKSTSWSKGQVTYKEQVVVKTDDEVILNSYSGSRLRPFTSYGELNLLLSYMTLYVCLMSDLCKASHPSQLGATIKGNFHRLYYSTTDCHASHLHHGFILTYLGTCSSWKSALILIWKMDRPRPIICIWDMDTSNLFANSIIYFNTQKLSWFISLTSLMSSLFEIINQNN